MAMVPESIDSQIEELRQSCGDGAMLELRRLELATRPAQPPLVSQRFVTWRAGVIDEEMTAASGKASKVTHSWKTEPALTQGEISIEAALSPSRRKSNSRHLDLPWAERPHGAPSVGTPSCGGTTWSYIAPACSADGDALQVSDTRTWLEKVHQPHVVVGHEQHSLAPARPGSYCFVNVLQQSLAFRDVVARVIRR